LAETKTLNEPYSQLSRGDQQISEAQQETSAPERMYGDQQIDQSQIAKIERGQPSLMPNKTQNQNIPQQSSQPVAKTNRAERDQEILSEQPSLNSNKHTMEQQVYDQSHDKQEGREFRDQKSNLDDELHQKLRLKPSENVESKEKSLAIDKQRKPSEEKSFPMEKRSSTEKKEEMSSSADDESYLTKQKKHNISKEASEFAQTFEFEDLISYLNEHKAVIEEALTDEDKKRIKIIVNLGRDLKILYKDTIETIKADLVKYYEAFRSKWENTMQDLNKLQEAHQETLQ
jgi:hypothetical protein